jgi:hypothetical protein
MRKTIILAIATTFLAGASVATGLTRSFHNSLGATISSLSVVVPLATDAPTASSLPSA